MACSILELGCFHQWIWLDPDFDKLADYQWPDDSRLNAIMVHNQFIRISGTVRHLDLKVDDIHSSLPFFSSGRRCSQSYPPAGFQLVVNALLSSSWLTNLFAASGHPGRLPWDSSRCWSGSSRGSSSPATDPAYADSFHRLRVFQFHLEHKFIQKVYS